MTDPRQVLLELICYASDMRKPALLKVRPESILELCTQGLIERRENGYWITELGREQCQQRNIDLASSANVVDLNPSQEIYQPSDASSPRLGRRAEPDFLSRF
jgi:hypothetical protein